MIEAKDVIDLLQDGEKWIDIFSNRKEDELDFLIEFSEQGTTPNTVYFLLRKEGHTMYLGYDKKSKMMSQKRLEVFLSRLKTGIENHPTMRLRFVTRGLKWGDVDVIPPYSYRCIWISDAPEIRIFP